MFLISQIDLNLYGLTKSYDLHAVICFLKQFPTNSISYIYIKTH